MRRPTSFARRFIAGETVEEAIDAARAHRGGGPAADARPSSARASRRWRRRTRRRAPTSASSSGSSPRGIERNISLKLTQLGLTVDRATCVDNLRRILDAAGARDFFVRIDMENSPYTQVTLDVFETMWQQGYRNAGVVLQSYLPRSEADAARHERARRARAARQGRVQGAAEASPISRKADVDAAFVEIMQLLLDRGHLSGDRDARSGDDRRDARVARPSAASPRSATSSRCCTASGGICRQSADSARATASASTSHSAVNGSPTSCAGWVNGRPISDFVIRGVLRER